MQDSGWLKLITIGLILAALAVGYFLFNGKLIPSNFVKTKPQTTNVASITGSPTPSASVLGQNVQAAPGASPQPASQSAYERVANRTQNQVQTLPKTGFPEAMAGIVFVGVMISGWSLRKFPH